MQTGRCEWGVYFLSMSSCTRQVGELAFEQIAAELWVVELEDAGGGDVAEKIIEGCD
jgi:hypothetical protein